MYSVIGNKVYEDDEYVRHEYVGDLDGKLCPKCKSKTFINYWDSGQGCGATRECTNNHCDFIINLY